MKKTMVLGLCASVLTACGMIGAPTPMAVESLPVFAGKWKDLGTTNAGNIVVAYEVDSVRKNGRYAQLRDRKIVVDPSREQYVSTPRYKVALNDWEFDCTQRTYRLLGVQFLNEQALLIQRFMVKDIPPILIKENSIAHKQFDVACR